MIIVIGGIKGGGGKTTISTNLTVILDRDGKKVLLVDADEQKSVSTWIEERISKNIPTNWTTIQLFGKSLYTEVKKLEKDYDHIIIDVGGRDTTSQRSALIVADRYIVPFRPRSLDIWTIGLLRQMIQEITAVNHKLITIAVINQADSKGTDNIEANKIISEYPEINCLNFFIGNRKAFANAASDGLSVIEMEHLDKKACAEITMLYEYIFQVNYVS